MNPAASKARRLAVVVAAAAALALSGCAAGQIAQTAQEVSTLDAVHAQVGDITITAYLKAPGSGPCYLPGATAPMGLVLVNGGPDPDSLESISSPRFTAMAVAASAGDAAKILAAGSGSGSCGGTAAPATGAPAGGTAGLPEPAPAPSLTAHTATLLGISGTGTDLSDNPVVLLEGLQKGPLWPGNSVELTFTFTKAGKLTISVPVQLSLLPHTAIVPKPSGAED